MIIINNYIVVQLCFKSVCHPAQKDLAGSEMISCWLSSTSQMVHSEVMEQQLVQNSLSWQVDAVIVQTLWDSNTVTLISCVFPTLRNVNVQPLTDSAFTSR